MTIWDGGWSDQAEEEREVAWHSQPDEWRGDVHLEDWPESAYLSGEYGLFKRELGGSWWAR